MAKKNDYFRIIELIQKSNCNELTEGEESELNALLDSEELRDIYKEISKGPVVSERLKEYEQYHYADAFKRFKESDHFKKTIRRRILMRTAVAASFLLLVALTAMFILNRSALKPSVEDALAPGNNCAQLVLSNGQKVSIGGESVQITDADGKKINYDGKSLSYEGDDAGAVISYNELIVPKGGECNVVLSDGSKVWLNAGSKMKYPVKFIGKQRRIYLTGEAYFEVEKNGKQFVVETRLGDVCVLGTSFNVKVYEEESMYTTLVGGSVEYRGGSTMKLIPGEQAVVSSNGQVEKRTVNVSEFVAWKYGRFVFDEEPIEEIMKEMSRWYDLKIVYADEAVRKETFTGNVKRYESFNNIIDMLEMTKVAKFSVDGKTIRISTYKR